MSTLDRFGLPWWRRSRHVSTPRVGRWSLSIWLRCDPAYLLVGIDHGTDEDGDRVTRLGAGPFTADVRVVRHLTAAELDARRADFAARVAPRLVEDLTAFLRDQRGPA